MNETAQAIVDAAISHFAKKGYAGTSIKEIIEATGTSKATLYYYFASKEILLRKAFEAYFNPFLRQVEAATSYKYDLKSNLTQLVKIFLQLARTKPDFFIMMFSMESSPLEGEVWHIVEEYYANLECHVQNLFEHSMKEHPNMNRYAAHLTPTFMAIINAYGFKTSLSQIFVDDSIIDTIVHQFMHGIYS